MMKRTSAHKNQLNIDEGATPEHDLWVTVLSKAAHDALYCTDWRESRIAIAWFKAGGFNFRKVCEYAGRDPSYVHKVMKLPIQKRENEMNGKRN